MVLIKFSKRKNDEAINSNSNFYLCSRASTISSLSPMSLRRMIMVERESYSMEFLPFVVTDVKFGVFLKNLILFCLRTLKKEIIEKSIIFKIWRIK